MGWRFGSLMVNTYGVDLGVSQRWAGFPLFLDAGQVSGNKGGATAQSPWLPPLGLKGPFRKKASSQMSPGRRKSEMAACVTRSPLAKGTAKLLSLNTL